MKNNSNKLVLLSLVAYTVSWLTFITGLQLNDFIGLVCLYCTSSLLTIITIIALIKNYNKDRKIYIYTYLIGIGIALQLLYTYGVFISI